MSALIHPTIDGRRPDYERSLLSLGLSPAAAESIARKWPDPASLSGASPAMLRSHGLTASQAGRLLGAVELARLAHQPPRRRGCEGPDSVVHLVAPMIAMAEQEMLAVVLLDAQWRAIDVSVVAMGTPSGVYVAPREVFRDAIRAGAESVVIAHNHPSGDPSPSREDETFTRRMAGAGRLLGMPLTDHIVIARGGAFFSFADKGLLRPRK